MWKIYTRLSLYTKDGNPPNPKILIEDLIGGKKYKASPRQVAESIIKKEYSKYTSFFSQIGITNYSYTDKEKIEIHNTKHWLNRNWISSLFYYLSTRNIQFCDTSEDAKFIRADLIKNYLKEEGKPALYEPKGSIKILPPPQTLNPSSNEIAKSLLDRKTVRSYQNKFLSLENLSTLLYYGLQDIREARKVSLKGSENNSLNFYYSHGLAFDYFLIIYRVKNLSSGIYYYNLIENKLILIKEGDYQDFMIDCLQGMSSPKTANLTIILTADFYKYKWVYRHERALRNLYIESGRSIQEILQASMLLNLGGLCTPAIKDSKLLSILDLDKNRFSPMYTLTLGFKNGSSTFKENI